MTETKLMPDEVHECVRSVLEDNPDMAEERAWAICQAEIDAEAATVARRTELNLEAETFNDLADRDESWTAVDGGWINTEEALAVCDAEALGATEQAQAFAADVFRIVQADDDGMDLDGDLMGVGVDFPNAGVYVDWRIDAWPDDEQLDEPHVSDYGSIEDLEQATGGVVEHLQTVDAAAATPSADDTDVQTVTISGISQEAIEAIERRYNADVSDAVVDGEAGAAPTDHESQPE